MLTLVQVQDELGSVIGSHEVGAAPGPRRDPDQLDITVWLVCFPGLHVINVDVERLKRQVDLIIIGFIFDRIAPIEDGVLQLNGLRADVNHHTVQVVELHALPNILHLHIYGSIHFVYPVHEPFLFALLVDDPLLSAPDPAGLCLSEHFVDGLALCVGEDVQDVLRYFTIIEHALIGGDSCFLDQLAEVVDGIGIDLLFPGRKQLTLVLKALT